MTNENVVSQDMRSIAKLAIAKPMISEVKNSRKNDRVTFASSSISANALRTNTNMNDSVTAEKSSQSTR